MELRFEMGELCVLWFGYPSGSVIWVATKETCIVFTGPCKCFQMSSYFDNMATKYEFEWGKRSVFMTQSWLYEWSEIMSSLSKIIQWIFSPLLLELYSGHLFIKDITSVSWFLDISKDRLLWEIKLTLFRCSNNPNRAIFRVKRIINGDSLQNLSMRLQSWAEILWWKGRGGLSLWESLVSRDLFWGNAPRHSLREMTQVPSQGKILTL
jgi:hypothetical protein